MNGRLLVGRLAAAIYNDFTEKWHVAVVDLDQQASESVSCPFERMGVMLHWMSGHSVHRRMEMPPSHG